MSEAIRTDNDDFRLKNGMVLDEELGKMIMSNSIEDLEDFGMVSPSISHKVA
jgi:hypothetical protein